MGAMWRREFLSGVLLAIRRNRIDEAEAIIRREVAGGVESVALHVEQGGEVIARGYGRARAESVFLLASITKPMTAAAVMMLRDQGRLALTDKVQKHLPEFTGGERGRVEIRHLLSHTSGLPDMLPENEALRKRHAPLREFVAGALRTPLLFSPGERMQYQSMGILLAAEIVERLTGRPLREFLRTELFGPLGMKSASLGLGGRKVEQLVHSQVKEVTDWDWNSGYWRDLGAPWGGAHANAADVARLLKFFLEPRDLGTMRASTVREMVTNQNGGLAKGSWGIGWKVGPGEFGRACSVATFGHSGSTGTLAWADPAKKLIFVMLTSKPADESRRTLLGPVSDAVSEA